MAAGVHTGTGAGEQVMNAGDLIRRVEVLMSDERYPPLYNLRVNPDILFSVRYRRH